MSHNADRHPLRTLLLVVVTAAIAVAFRNAVADKGGSYDPAAREA